jgi:hypothetical protein
LLNMTRFGKKAPLLSTNIQCVFGINENWN